MEEVINKLDYNGLVPIWNVTFPGWPIEEYIDTLSYDNQDDILEDIRSLLIDEIKNNERKRQKEQDEHVESLMNMEPQPEIKQKKQMRRKGKKFIEAIKSQHQKRQQRINKLHEIYNNQRDKEEGFYEWLRNKDAPADDENIKAFLDSIHLDSVIDFSTLNRNEREKVFETMKARFEEVFGTLEITDNFLIHYRTVLRLCYQVLQI